MFRSHKRYVIYKTIVRQHDAFYFYHTVVPMSNSCNSPPMALCPQIEHQYSISDRLYHWRILLCLVDSCDSFMNLTRIVPFALEKYESDDLKEWNYVYLNSLLSFLLSINHKYATLVNGIIFILISQYQLHVDLPSIILSFLLDWVADSATLFRY